RHVGGDYYDFFSLGQGRLGLFIGDISGKGIAAALLMANLQANLRSQFALAREQPHEFLRSVNRLFYDNTADSSYATVFFAEYNDATQCLRYANCGHLSGLLLRHDQTVEWLRSTATVLGLFKEWDSPIVECNLTRDDTLVLYTDGVTEALNAAEEEFGEAGLVEAVKRHHTQDAQTMITSLVDELQRFSSGEQHDDMTLIVAKCRASLTN
ncbi:MAG: serine/threonine-protein phosphatase, partial [Acidobacteriaceae bacterium]|nr:serine/threonine-protein phosphatase [Acidobacteriaceae bacterium]